MKRVLSVCLVVLIIALVLSGCGRTLSPIKSAASTPDEWKDLKYVAEHYSLEDARRDGYVIMEDGSVTSGEDIWEDFVRTSEKKASCKVRVVHYYTLGEPDQYDSSYYESVKDDYPAMYILELEYDGETFHERHYEEDELYQVEYKYLMRYEGEAEIPQATYTSYIRYVLTNDNTVTWDDIMHGITSSKFGDYIPHSMIYADLVYKEG